MSNLENAKAAIEAEIIHAKEGFAFYASRVKALERTLLQLSNLGAEEGAASEAATPTAIKRGQKAGTKKSSKKAKGAQAGGNELPFTGKDFWPDLVTAEPRSASEILQAAIGRLGFTPTKEQVQKLTGRMIFAINSLVKANVIQDSGKGRERRFFKPAAK